MRREIMKKINGEMKERLENALNEEEEQMDEQTFKDKLIEEIEKELQAEEDDKGKKKNSFMQKLLNNQRENSRKEAEKLLEKLKNNENIEDLDISDPEKEKGDEDEEENTVNKKRAPEDKPKLVDPFVGRKKFHKDESNPTNIQIEETKKNKKGQTVEKTLLSYVENPTEVIHF
jgi:hypothetical protein